MYSIYRYWLEHRYSRHDRPDLQLLLLQPSEPAHQYDLPLPADPSRSTAGGLQTDSKENSAGNGKDASDKIETELKTASDRRACLVFSVLVIVKMNPKDESKQWNFWYASSRVVECPYFTYFMAVFHATRWSHYIFGAIVSLHNNVTKFSMRIIA